VYGSSAEDDQNRYQYTVAKGVVSFVENGVSILVRHVDLAGMYSVVILGKSVSADRTELDVLDKVAKLVDDVIRVCAEHLAGVNLVEEACRPSSEASEALREERSEKVERVKALVVEPGYIMDGWAEEGRDVKAADLLTREELGKVLNDLQKGHQSSLEFAGLVLKGPSSEPHHEETLDPSDPRFQGDLGRRVFDILTAIHELKEDNHREFSQTRELLERQHSEIMEAFSRLQAGQKELLQNLQALHRFTRTQKNLPRFMELEHVNAGFSVPRLVKRAVALHLLCEGRAIPHRVAGRDGKEIEVTREWITAVSPWLKFSLKLLVVLVKVGVNVVAPGAGVVIPGVEGLQPIFEDTPMDALVREYTASQVAALVEQRVESFADEFEQESETGVQAPKGLSIEEVWALLEQPGVRVTPASIPGDFGLHRVEFRREFEGNKPGQVAWVCGGCLDGDLRAYVQVL
jgi:hypothetical protein